MRHPFTKPFPLGQWQRIEIDADFTEMPGTLHVRFGDEVVATGPMTTAENDRNGSSVEFGSTVVAMIREGTNVLESDASAVMIDDLLVRLE